MKEILFLIFLLCFISGCTSVQTVRQNLAERSKLASVLVFLSDVPLGFSGTDPEGTMLDVNGTIYLSAQGRDYNNKPVAINPTWYTPQYGIISIDTVNSSLVMIRGLRKGTASIVVDSEGVRKTINNVTVK